MGKLSNLFAGFIFVFAPILLVGRFYPLGIFIALIICGPVACVVAREAKNGGVAGLFSRFYLLLSTLIAIGLSTFYLGFAFDLSKEATLLSSLSSASCIVGGATLLLAFSIKRKNVWKW